MAKKSKKIEKETRRLIESVTDLVKKKGDGYKFKTKNKKTIKKIKKTCVHWVIRKGKEFPTVIQDPNDSSYWICTICGARFPVKPVKKVIREAVPEKNIPEITENVYAKRADQMLELVNQMQFYSVKLGGDAEDTKMFLRLREALPRFKKVSSQIIKQTNKRDQWNKKNKTGALNRFNSYSSFNYKP